MDNKAYLASRGWHELRASVGRGLASWGVPAIVVIVGISAFGFGRFSALETAAEPIIVRVTEPIAAPRAGVVAGVASSTPKEGGYVGSRTGSAYHLPWCPGAQMIAEKNRVYFNTREEAEALGYAPAKNCAGLVE